MRKNCCCCASLCCFSFNREKVPLRPSYWHSWLDGLSKLYSWTINIHTCQCVRVWVCVCVRICLVINCAQQSIGLYLPALVLVAKQRCFCRALSQSALSLSLHSTLFWRAAAAAATTAIDNKRRRRQRAPTTFPSCLLFSPLRHFAFLFMNGGGNAEVDAKTNDQETQGTFLYMQNILERRNGWNGWEQKHKMKWNEIKWQKSKVFLLASARLVAATLHLILAAQHALLTA